MNMENFLNFSFVIDGKLAGLSYPFRSGNVGDIVHFLRQNRVSCLVNLTEYGYRAEDSNLINIFKFPVPDFGVPSMEQMDEIWNHYISLPEDDAMAVHCLAGRGRTGMVLACIVARQLEMKPLDAVFYIRHIRPGSIETGEQEEFVEEWVYSH